MQARLDPPSPLTLLGLAFHLWEAANILRGSPVDRTDWRSCILSLLVFNRICDVWDEAHDALDPREGETSDDPACGTNNMLLPAGPNTDLIATPLRPRAATPWSQPC